MKNKKLDFRVSALICSLLLFPWTSWGLNSEDVIPNGLEANSLHLKSKLTLKKIIGRNLSTQKVRKIMKYSCTQSFFEGEGIGPNQISCSAGQHLGLIYADYDFYLYQSQVDNNITKKGGDRAWPNVCNAWFVPLRMNCGAQVPNLRFGLYGEQQGKFQVLVRLSANDSDNSYEATGFAALPNAKGECARGLVKIRPFVAQPASMVHPSNCQNSTFVNTSGALNNTVVEEVGFNASAKFNVLRQASFGNSDCSRGSVDTGAAPSKENCRMTASTTKGVGDCSELTLDPVAVAQSVSYTPLTPVVCAIDKAYLSDL